MQGEGIDICPLCEKVAILWKCLNTFVLLHCGQINLQAYKSCYASQREIVAKIMLESPLSVILSTVHQFYSLYPKVPVPNTSIQITIKELHLYA